MDQDFSACQSHRHQRFLTIHISSQISCNCLFIVFMALCHECERVAFPAPFMTNSWRSLPQFILHRKHGILWNVITPGRKNTSTQPFLQIARTSPWKEATSPTHMKNSVAIIMEKCDIPLPSKKWIPTQEVNSSPPHWGRSMTGNPLLDARFWSSIPME